MATLVQAPTTGDSSQGTLAYTSDVVANNLGICLLRVSSGDGTPTGITDTRGSTWTQVGSALSISTGIGYLYFTVFPSSGANTITIGGGATARILLEEVNGLGAGATLDSTNQGTGTSTTPSAGNISPAVASWIFGGLIMTNYPSVDPTANSGYTRRGSGVLKFYGEDQNSASGGTYSGGWTLPESNTWGAIVAAFNAAGSSAGGRLINGNLVNGLLVGSLA